MQEFWCVSKIEDDQDSRTYFVFDGDLADPASHVVGIDTTKRIWELWDGDEIFRVHSRSRLSQMHETARYMILVKRRKQPCFGNC